MYLTRPSVCLKSKTAKPGFTFDTLGIIRPWCVDGYSINMSVHMSLKSDKIWCEHIKQKPGNISHKLNNGDEFRWKKTIFLISTHTKGTFIDAHNRILQITSAMAVQLLVKSLAVTSVYCPHISTTPTITDLFLKLLTAWVHETMDW